MSEEDLNECHRREATRPRKPARFRVGGGPWVEFSTKSYRCVPVPIGAPFWVVVEHFASWKESVGSRCESRVKDLVEPNFYGSLTTRCSRRRFDADERRSDYPLPKALETKKK